jgi:hypothetical protein
VTRQEQPEASGHHGSPRIVESKASVGFLAAPRGAARQEPQAHARVRGELTRGGRELQESERPRLF